MDCLYLAFLFFIIFISVCIVIMFAGDSDILTFVCAHLGKVPAAAYTDKVVWVTGASSGLGEGLAKELAKCNAKLVLSGTRKDELDRVKTECFAVNPILKPCDVVVLPFDMLDLSSHEPAFKKIMSHFGQLDVLVSNAGRFQSGIWHEDQLKVDRELFEQGVFAIVNLNRHVLKYYLQKGSGQLAVISSIAGKIGWPNCASFTGSKHALHGFFEGLRVETLGRNIDITVLCPGPVSPVVLTRAVPSQPGQSGATNNNPQGGPTNRLMTPERCAYLCVVAMANRLNESWISLLPTIPMMYLHAYQPFLFNFCCRLFGAAFFEKSYGDPEMLMA